MSKLIILRGNSGSGKSTVALEIAKHSAEKTAIVDADRYRVDMLFPKPVHGPDLAELMRHNVMYCLDHGYNVLWDSIFYATEQNKDYIGECLNKLHPKDNFIFTFDVSFEETARRHNLRHKSNDFGVEEMKTWYQPVEKLGYDFEYVIPESNSLKETVNLIKSTAQI